eukprot:9293_1
MSTMPGLSIRYVTNNKEMNSNLVSISKRFLQSGLRTKKTCLMLPAQGVEFPGMCRDIVRDFPYIRSFMNDCDDYLNLPLSRVMLDGHPNELAQYEYAGNATFVGTMCFWRILQREYDLDNLLSDHDVSIISSSFGEYTALELTKACKSFEDALYLSNLICVWCKKYGCEDKGMYQIKCKAEHALDLEWLSPIIEKHNLYFANINGQNQVIVGGWKHDIQSMIDETGLDVYRKSDGLRGVYLSPKGAFHTPLGWLKDGVSEFHEQWKSIELNPTLKYDLYLSVTGDRYDVQKGDNIANLMMTQLYSKVNFYECIQNYMKRHGNDDEADIEMNFVEIGPRVVLQKMLKDIFKYHRYDNNKKCNIRSINSTKSIQDFQSIFY